MAVTSDDLRIVADLARLELSPEQTTQLLADLNGILAHFERLAAIDTSGLTAVSGVGAQGAPLRSDSGPPEPLARPPQDLAPATRQGFIIVPRLSSHRSTLGE